MPQPMADPPGPQQTAEGAIVIFDDWLRRRAADGEPPLGPVLRATLAEAALRAARLAAARPLLLRALGPRVAFQVKAEAIAQAASELAAAASGGAVWISPAQAGRVLSIKADTVRWLCRRGRISGRRAERGWRVDARSVAAYAGRRRYDRREAVHRGHLVRDS
jgi:hypothetical protein